MSKITVPRIARKIVTAGKNCHDTGSIDLEKMFLFRARVEGIRGKYAILEAEVRGWLFGSGDSHVIKNDTVDSKGEDKKKSDECGSDRILACGYSTTGQYFALCDDHKVLTLWKTGPKWAQLSSRQLTRRATSLRFTHSDDAVLIADKSGDAYSFSTSSPGQDGCLLLGHVSMLLDLEMCGEGLVATCDRDEKIRISHYPNAHSIKSFCLGHKDFVSQLLYISKHDLLVSGSGDGTLRLWDYRTGKILHVTDCSHQLPGSPSNGTSAASSEQPSNGGAAGADRVCVRCVTCCQKKDIIAVSFYLRPVVLVYAMSVKDQTTRLDHRQTILCASEVWNINLDSTGRLWVVFQTRPHLSIFEHDTEQFMPLSNTDDHRLLGIMDTVNNDAEFFKDVTTEESLMNVLLNKRTFDAAKDPSCSKGNKRKVPKKEGGEHSTPAKHPLVSNAIQP